MKYNFLLKYGYLLQLLSLLTHPQINIAFYLSVRDCVNVSMVSRVLIPHPGILFIIHTHNSIFIIIFQTTDYGENSTEWFHTTLEVC
jgi:hypothetical protein